MANYEKFNQTIEDIYHGVHNFGGATQLMVALCDVAPVATDATLADLSAKVITYTNLLNDPTSREITINTSEGSDGNYELVLADLTLTASGGPMDSFRYVVVYNDTPTSPADPLICYFDYASALVLADGESLTIDFASDGGSSGQLFTAS